MNMFDNTGNTSCILGLCDNTDNTSCILGLCDNTDNTSCISGLCDVTISLNVHDDDGSGRLTGRRASAKARHVTISLNVSDDDGSGRQVRDGAAGGKYGKARRRH